MPFHEVGKFVKEIDRGVREIQNNAFDLLDLKCLLDSKVEISRRQFKNGYFT